MKFLDVWVGEFFRLLIAEDRGERSPGDARYRSVSIQRDSYSEKLCPIARWGSSFEEILLKMAAEWEAAAKALRELAPRAQSLMDSGDATMTPYERATADQISQLVIDLGHEQENAFDRERYFDLASQIRHGAWKHHG